MSEQQIWTALTNVCTKNTNIRDHKNNLSQQMDVWESLRLKKTGAFKIFPRLFWSVLTIWFSSFTKMKQRQTWGDAADRQTDSLAVSWGLKTPVSSPCTRGCRRSGCCGPEDPRTRWYWSCWWAEPLTHPAEVHLKLQDTDKRDNYIPTLALAQIARR